MKKTILLLLGAMYVLGSSISADENMWLYTKGTDTLPQGAKELKLSTMLRHGKNSGDYNFYDFRPEFEYGLTNHITLMAEVMIFHHTYSVSDEINPMFETQGGAGSRFQGTELAGFEIGYKQNILSPYKDFVGFAYSLVWEHRYRYRLDGAKIDQNSYVASAYIQKNWLDDTLTWAFNGKIELEERNSPGVFEKEIALDFSTGIAYRVAPKHFVGIEVRHQSDYLSPYDTEAGDFAEPDLKPSDWGLTHLTFGTQHQNGLYVGPTYHYAEKSWWLTTGVLFQVAGGGSEHAFVEDGKSWDEHEEYHLGFTIGYEFQ